MIHRAPFGSMERFVAILLEHTGGNFPLWLMPEQATVLTLSENYENYAQNVLTLLENHDVRATIDDRGETMGRKIREAEMQKTPYMLIIGEKEANDGTVSVRKHGGEDLGTMTVADFAKIIEAEIAQTLKKFEV